ncbi:MULTISPECIES: carboxymuconolactone decarboxylase family protein [unclassified Streptomyces]|jgi:AhpD family alkylhydroperoxidase|uniref:carboxymuconolactone decarboxylase family protein n=1 Tax=unclassified Streptomyces TaxID=2593676 RepID=UPI000746C882|nr:4-carboxymuconolactone decarboxylase [Streptomyces sp. NRRL WC-3604]KUL78405.1 4-carboxymuconolactone decarboxylase [Streptomyces sp. NRRL WC-3605]
MTTNTSTDNGTWGGTGLEAGTVPDIDAAVAAAEATRTRLDFAKAAPKVFRAIVGLDAAARNGLDPALVELVQIRASHLNHCAYCLHMHTNDARKAGESEDRLHMVPVWREARHFFSEREQAALALTEAVTLVSGGGVPDDVYADAAAHFDEGELAQLLALIMTINTWNRVALATGKVAGTDERRPAGR